MKKMKKSISLILALIMIFSVAPLQCFAVGPTLEKVEFIDNTPISVQYYQDAFSNGDEYYDQLTLYSVEEDYRYDYKLYFSNGRTLSTEGNFTEEYVLCGVDDYYIETYINRDDFLKAVDEGKSTVKVTVCVEIDRIIGQNETYKFEIEKEMAEGYVKSVRLIGDMPGGLSVGGYVADEFNGRDVEVEYYDGRKEVHKIVCEEEETCFCYIDDKLAIMFYFEDDYFNEETNQSVYVKGLTLDYLDFDSEIVREETICPFSFIELLHYRTNGKGSLTEVTYRLVCEDGRVIEKTCKPDGRKDKYGRLIIDTVDGYNVLAYLRVDSTYYNACVELEDFWRVSDWTDSEEAREICDCICHENGFKYLISFILIKIWKLFRVKEICQCGCQHWISNI